MKKIKEIYKIEIITCKLLEHLLYKLKSDHIIAKAQLDKEIK